MEQCSGELSDQEIKRIIHLFEAILDSRKKGVAGSPASICVSSEHSLD